MLETHTRQPFGLPWRDRMIKNSDMMVMMMIIVDNNYGWVYNVEELEVIRVDSFELRQVGNAIASACRLTEWIGLN